MERGADPTLQGVFGGVRKIGGVATGHGRTASVGSSIEGFVPPVPALPAYAVDQNPSNGNGNGNGNGSPRELSSSLNDGGGGRTPFGGASGTLSVTLQSLAGVGDAEEKKAIAMKHNSKAVDMTHAQKGDPATYSDSFVVKTSESPCQLDFTVLSVLSPPLPRHESKTDAWGLLYRHKKAFGKDVVLGDSSLNVWEHLSPLTSPTTTVQLPVGDGTLTVMLSVSSFLCPH